MLSLEVQQCNQAFPATGLVQLAAVSNADKAKQIAEKLKGQFQTKVDLMKVEKTDIYRVRLGPYLDRDEAMAQRDKAKASLYPKAFIIFIAYIL